jgi:hypothetical protein
MMNGASQVVPGWHTGRSAPSRITDSSFFGTVKAVPSTLPNARAAIGSFLFAQKTENQKGHLFKT